MGHVGEKFRFVFGSQRQLGGLFLQGVARLFDFSVFTLNLGVLLSQLLRLVAKFLDWFAAVLSVATCSSLASFCDCWSKPSVRMVASMVLSTMPMLSVS